MSDSIANGYGCRPCKQVQLNVTDAIIHFIGDGSALSHLNASNVDFGTLSTSVFPVSGVTAGTYGSSSNVSQVTVDQYGRVLFSQNVAITSSQWTGQPGSSIYYIPGVSIGSSNDATANLQVTGNVYVSNAVTTTNVFATRYYGDGGLLSNITSFIQPLANLVVSNSVTTTNVFAVTANVGTLNVWQVSNLSTLSLTNNLYVSNAVTTTNVFATRYYGDGGLLSNISSSAITQPFANLVVSNSVTTTNVFAANVNVNDTFGVLGSMTANAANATFFFDTFTIPYINTQYMNVASSITAPLANIATMNVDYLTVNSAVVYGTNTLNVYGTSNLTNVFATNYYGDGGLLSNVATQPFANLVVSNAVTATNLFASNTLSVGPGTLGSNVVVFSNISGGSNTFVMDSNGRVTIGSTYTGGSLLSFGQQIANKVITMYDNNNADNPFNATNFYGFGRNTNLLRYQVNDTGAAHTFFGGTTEYARITSTGLSILTGANPTSKLQVTGNAYISNAVTTTNLFANTLTMSNATSTINVTGNIFASNAVTTNNLFTAGITSNVTSTVFNSDTLTIPFVYSTTLNVASTSNLDTVTLTGEPGLTTLFASGNAYVSNAVTTTNIFANTLTMSNATSTINVTGNIYASNAVTTTNLFASNTLSVGPGTLGSNIVVFSNVSGGSNFVMDSNGRVTIGSRYTGGSALSFGQTVATKMISLYDSNSADNPVTGTNFFGFGIGSNTLRYQVTGTGIHAFYVGGNNESIRVSAGGLSIMTGANPTSNLQVTGNAYVSNAVTTTNIFANTLTMSNATSTINVTGNIYAANAVTTTNVFATTVTATNVIGTHYGVLAGSNTVSASTVTGTNVIGTHYGVLAGSNTVSGSTQTLTGITDQTTLNATGNIYVSNALTTTNVFATTVTGTNVIGTHYGVLAGSNTVSASTVTATNVIGTHYGVLAGSNTISGSTQTLTGITNKTTLNATGNIYASNAITTTNIFTTGNVTVGDLLTVGGLAGFTSLDVTGNIKASNSVTTTNVYLLSSLTNSTTGQIVKGAFEFNGTSNVFYGTSSTVRGIIPIQYFYQLNTDTAFDTTLSATDVSAFPGFVNGIQLQNGKYYIKMIYILTITTSATAGNTQLNMIFNGGTSTASLVGCGLFTYNITSTTAPGSSITVTSSTSIYITGMNTERVSAVTTATSTATTYYTTIEGTFSITAPGGMYPIASITSPGAFTATPGVRRGSFIYLQKIGDNGADVNIGGWS